VHSSRCLSRADTPLPRQAHPYPGLDPNSLPQSLIEQGRKGLGTRHVRNQIAHGPPTDGTPCVQLDRTGVGATGTKTLLRAEREQGWCVYVHYEVRTSYGTTRSAHSDYGQWPMPSHTVHCAARTLWLLSLSTPLQARWG